MAATIELLDTVALLVDLPELGLKAGGVGAVVEVLGDGRAFEAEFADDSGVPYGLHALKADQLIRCVSSRRSGSRKVSAHVGHPVLGYLQRPGDESYLKTTS